jgi:hypothetical protein
MTRHALRFAAVPVLAAGLAFAAGTPAPAADTYAATITANAEKIVFSHGMAWIDKKGRVSVGFYNAEPNAKEQARAMQDGGEIFGVFEGPNVTFDLGFKDGATKADLPGFESCHIHFSHFKAGMGIFDLSTFAKDCGPVAFSGDLKPGAVVHGKLKGTGQEGFPDKDGKKPVYTWDVDFTATVRAKP